eukprot:755263-Hanusia_phi.AAC.1
MAPALRSVPTTVSKAHIDELIILTEFLNTGTRKDIGQASRLPPSLPVSFPEIKDEGLDMLVSLCGGIIFGSPGRKLPLPIVFIPLAPELPSPLALARSSAGSCGAALPTLGGLKGKWHLPTPTLSHIPMPIMPAEGGFELTPSDILLFFSGSQVYRSGLFDMFAQTFNPPSALGRWMPWKNLWLQLPALLSSFITRQGALPFSLQCHAQGHQEALDWENTHVNNRVFNF